MPNEISSVLIGGTSYDIKDATARSAISSLGTVVKFKGTKADAATIKALTSATAGDLWITLDDSTEWVCTDTFSGGAQPSKWECLGSTAQTLGALAYADTTTASYTPAGSVTLGTPTKKSGLVSAAGSLPSWSASVTSEVLSFSFDAGSLPTIDSTEAVIALNGATFSGTAATITGNPSA